MKIKKVKLRLKMTLLQLCLVIKINLMRLRLLLGFGFSLLFCLLQYEPESSVIALFMNLQEILAHAFVGIHFLPFTRHLVDSNLLNSPRASRPLAAPLCHPPGDCWALRSMRARGIPPWAKESFSYLPVFQRAAGQVRRTWISYWFGGLPFP